MKCKMGNYDVLLYVGTFSSFSIAATTKLPYSPQKDALHDCPVDMKKDPEKQSHRSQIDPFKHPDVGIIDFQKKDISYFNFYVHTHTHTLCFASLQPSGSILQRYQNPYIDSFCHLFFIFLDFFLLHQNL